MTNGKHNLLRLDQLGYERDFCPVFAPVSCAVAAGELLLVTGPNGCGKTTLLRLLAGLTEPSQGQLEYGAEPATIAYIGHQSAVKADLTVLENLRFYAAFLGGSNETIDRLLDELQLKQVAGQLGRELSAGQRKRCALARLRLQQHRLWILDEPYVNLDSDGQAWLDRNLSQHLQQDGACILATHGNHRAAGISYQQLELQAFDGYQDGLA